MIVFAVAIYCVAMVLANLLAARFGPAVTPFNSFVLIGLDLALRDWLHMKIGRVSILSVICLTGIATYTMNPSAGVIAIASAISFTVAALVDMAVFYLTKGGWIRRSNISNIAGAAADSIAFPLIAFGSLLPGVVLAQFFCKVIGGTLWVVLISEMTKTNRRRIESTE